MAKAKEKKLIPKSKLVSAIRRLWLHSWQRREAIKQASNHCKVCGDFAEKLTVDHIISAVPVTGWDEDWTGYITRMFVDPANGLRAICYDCHEAITKVQNNQRKFHREKLKSEREPTKPVKKSKKSKGTDTTTDGA
jgi:hypothetical protein